MKRNYTLYKDAAHYMTRDILKGSEEEIKHRVDMKVKSFINNANKTGKAVLPAEIDNKRIAAREDI